MRAHVLRAVLALSVGVGIGSGVRADDYVIDAVHSGVSFQISHVGLSYVQGRFNDFSGNFTHRHKRPVEVVVCPDDQGRER